MQSSGLNCSNKLNKTNGGELVNTNSHILINKGITNFKGENNLTSDVDNIDGSAILNDSGKVNILDKFNLSDNFKVGIYNFDTGTLVLGTNDDMYSQYPIIKGKKYSIQSETGNISWYDGTLYGKKLFALHGVINNSLNSYDVKVENVDDNTEKLYLEKEEEFTTNVAKVNDIEFKTLTDAINSSNNGVLIS